MDFLNYVQEEKDKIDEFLRKKFLELIKNEPEFSIKSFYTQLMNFILPKGGPAKRLRPLVSIHTFFGLASDDKIDDLLDEMRKISVAVELLHNADLIFEDLLDDEHMRRGLPTFHKLTLEVFENINQNPSADLKRISFNAGYSGYEFSIAEGISTITNSRFSMNQKYLALQAYIKAVSSIIRGRVIEANLMVTNLDECSIEDYLMMAEARNAIQFIIAAEIGAIMTDARGSQIDPLKDMMKYIGIAYHIVKDIEESFGDPNLKTIDLDIRRKKRNILTISAYKNCPNIDRERFKSLYEKKDELSDEEVKFIKDQIKNCGAIDFSAVYAINLLSQAKTAMNQIYPGMRDDSYTFFELLIEYIENTLRLFLQADSK